MSKACSLAQGVERSVCKDEIDQTRHMNVLDYARCSERFDIDLLSLILASAALYSAEISTAERYNYYLQKD